MVEPTHEPAEISPGKMAGGRAWLEVAALAGLVLGVVAVARAWPRLPDTIPMHFDLAGRPDGWGNRKTVLLLPGISVFMYLMLTGVQRIPSRWYNYPVRITEENRERQHRLALGLIVSLKAALMGLFAHLTIAVLRTALGEASGIGAWTVALWLGVIFGLVGVYLVRAFRAA